VLIYCLSGNRSDSSENPHVLLIFPVAGQVVLVFYLFNHAGMTLLLEAADFDHIGV
jgi:hypothetical protein